MSTAPLVITPGDPAGIGPEVAVRAAMALGVDAVLVGDAAAVARWASLPRVMEIGPGSGLRVYEPPGADAIEVRSIRAAVTACRGGRARALVTGPIHKARLAAQGFHHPGHTDFLGELCGVERPVMGFVGGSLRVCLVTVHLPLAAVAAAITRERVLGTIRVAAADLERCLGIERPRLLVCGLNPHAGDDGLLGREEIEVITPACAELRAEGLAVDGPVSAEAAFRRMQAGHADMVVAMYHDQGLGPLKLVDFGRSVNWTMGLPIVRTSVDHGTADDIAGQGVADDTSMRAAIELALQLTV